MAQFVRGERCCVKSPSPFACRPVGCPCHPAGALLSLVVLRLAGRGWGAVIWATTGIVDTVDVDSRPLTAYQHGQG